MATKGNILLIDNDTELLGLLRDLLQVNHYTVYSASTKDEVKHMLRYEDIHFDLAIIDMRLSDDDDTFDRSGMELARTIRPDIFKLLISGYEQFFEGLRVPPDTEFLYKQEGPEAILSKVADIFRNNIRLNRELIIEMGENISLKELMRQIEVYGGLTEERLAEKVYEFKSLLQRLFFREAKICLSQLAPGQGGSGVVLIQPFYKIGREDDYHTGAHVVVKFGLRDEMLEEVRRYREYVETFTPVDTTDIIGDVAKTTHLAGAKFRFVGAANGETRDFAAVFQDTANVTDGQVTTIIEHLFFANGAFWYANKRPWTANNGDASLSASYEALLRLDKAAAWDRVREQAEAIVTGEAVAAVQVERQDGSKLTFTTAASQETIPDPLTFLREHRCHLPDTSYYCITHGDLNGRNIFVDKNLDTWLIDFGRTELGPALRDAVQLESVIKYEFIKSHDLAALLALEAELTSPTTFTHSHELLRARPPDEFSRAVAAINKVREVAFRIAEVADMREYYAGLFFHALKMLTRDGYTPADKKRRAVRQRHALYSAARIAKQLQPAAVLEPEENKDVSNK